VSDPGRSRSWPQYLENGWRYTLGDNGAPIGNGYEMDTLNSSIVSYRIVSIPGNQMVTWPITSRDPEKSRSWPKYVWRPASQKRLQILTWWQWSTYKMSTWVDVTWPWRSKSWPQNDLCPVSQKRLVIQTSLQWSTYRICGKTAWRVKWSRDRWRHVTQKGQGRDPTMFDAHYLENGWKIRLLFLPDWLHGS